jgi:hypothetical protein
MKSKRLRSPQRAGRRKLVIGSGLVALSALGVWLTIETNNQTQEFLVAAQATTGGSPLTAADLKVTRMNLSDSSGLYLKPGDLPKGGYLLFSTEAGQLVPKSWVASAVIDSREPVVLTSTMPLPSKLKVGDLVDVWVSKKQDGAKYAAAIQLVLNAEVVEITEANGVLADQSPKVQVLVPTESVGPILDAIASKDALSLVLQRTLDNE